MQIGMGRSNLNMKKRGSWCTTASRQPESLCVLGLGCEPHLQQMRLHGPLALDRPVA